MRESSVTDLSYLREMAMDDEEIVMQTIEAFLEDTPKSLHNLKHHFDHQEWEQLARDAHKMKPNVKYMGMERAYELILNIEEQVKSGNATVGMSGEISEFRELCEQALQELSAQVERWKA